jgi:RNA polymerase sigma-70 factor (ECF subfamily)
MFYLEGRTYEEISTALGIPVNTIGPVLSRARKKLQQSNGAQPAAERKGTAKPEKAEKKAE